MRENGDAHPAPKGATVFTRPALLICCAAILSSGATLTVTPAVISDCFSDIVGIATLTWSGASGPVQIRVGRPTGPAMTSVVGPSGTAVTGAWVSNGLMFYLVDQAGNVEASATAQVKCGSAPPTVDQGLGGGSYFPLAIGNTWVYKYSNRFVTASYITQTISDQQYIKGQIYYVLTQDGSTIALLRADSSGVIWQYNSAGDQVYLDPGTSATSAYSGALGIFNDAIIPPPQVAGGLIQTISTYARGIGLVGSQSQMLSGSSGGFTEGLDLVDVRIDGFHLSVPAPKIALSIENTTLDLTRQLAPNCAVPCYFAACSLAPGADPPGTYRPCAQARIDTSAEVAGYTVLLELLNSTGTPVFQSSIENGLNYVRVPLYTGQTPFTLLPPGSYTLAGSIVLGGATLASSTILVNIQ
jgi:hypothetical protein